MKLELMYLGSQTNIAPWFHLRLPSCGRGFKSQAHHLSFFNLHYWNCNEKRTKINQKMPGLAHSLKKLYNKKLSLSSLRSWKILTSFNLSCVACSREMNPVCGNDGVTYNNDCLMRFATCKSNSVINKAYRGRCNATDSTLNQYGKKWCKCT